MRKSYLLLVVSFAVLFAVSKGGKTAQKDSDSDSTEVDSTAAEAVTEEVEEEVLMPTFIYYFNKNNMQVVYWTQHEAPEKPDEDDEYKDWYDDALRVWKEQDMLLRNAEKYNRMYITKDKFVNVKFLEEQYINPLLEIYGFVMLNFASMQ